MMFIVMIPRGVTIVAMRLEAMIVMRGLVEAMTIVMVMAIIIRAANHRRTNDQGPAALIII
jgi:hypothetical protein